MRRAPAIFGSSMVCGIAAVAIWLLTRDDAASVTPTHHGEEHRDVAASTPEPAAKATREAVAAEDSVVSHRDRMLRAREMAQAPGTVREVELTLSSALDGGQAGFDLHFEMSRPWPISDLPPGSVITAGPPPLRGTAQSPITRFKSIRGRVTLTIFATQSIVGERTVDLDAGDEPLRVEMLVNAVGPIAGHVVDDSDAAVPNPRIRLRVVDATGTTSESLLTTTTDARGGFVIPTLACSPGTSIALAAEHSAYASGDFVPIVRADRTVERTVTLRVGAHLCEVSGRVVDPALKTERDLIVHLRAASATKTDLTAHTDYDGRFRVLGALPGEYALTVERRCVTQPATPRIVVAPSAPAIDLGDIVAASPTLPLRVRVVNAAGDPVTNADLVVDGVLRANLGKDGRVATSVCADDACDVVIVARGRMGTFRVRAGRLPPDGSEHVLVAHFGGIVLNLRDRAAPNVVLPTRMARFVMRCGDREIRDERVVGDIGLVIESPDTDGTWTIELDVDGFEPCTVDVIVDSNARDAIKPYEVWMVRKSD